MKTGYGGIFSSIYSDICPRNCSRLLEARAQLPRLVMDTARYSEASPQWVGYCGEPASSGMDSRSFNDIIRISRSQPTSNCKPTMGNPVERGKLL